jgi:hypothetical protein
MLLPLFWVFRWMKTAKKTRVYPSFGWQRIGEMTGKVRESLQAEIHIRFYERGQLLYEGMGRNAGLEVAGAVDILWTAAWRR